MSDVATIDAALKLALKMIPHLVLEKRHLAEAIARLHFHHFLE
jgi:hypothetical protein